eukprot:SAG31_NODE_5803_length_2322_cov_2.405758_1_plen_145_part_00
MHRLLRSASHICGSPAAPSHALRCAASGPLLSSVASATMSTWAIEPDPIPSLPVFGSDTRFPVNRVWCVGRNYSEHAAEMRALGDTSGDEREPPFFFLKPGNAVVSHAAGVDATTPLSVVYPPQTSNYHFEVEMCVAIGVSRSE